MSAPVTHAAGPPVPANADELRDVNTRYHDGAAEQYDHKWGIDFGRPGQDQVLGKLRKVVGRDVPTFEHGLEIGAGTGYFALNLLQAGVLRRATACDISPGMIDALEGNAERLGLSVGTAVADAEALPFDDESFDLVFGHAVLHHIPDLAAAFAEFRRVLRPGGRLVFAGEPSRTGDRIARYPKQAAHRVAPLWRAALRAAPATPGHDDGGGDNHALEHLVDVHAFFPEDLRTPAATAGLSEVRVLGEELAANWFGWFNRGLEASARFEDVPDLWRSYAYHGYLLLQRVDRRLFEPRLPPGVFYNLMITATKA